jgi:hypothetical protein
MATNAGQGRQTDGEGTFAGRRGKDEVAPKPDPAAVAPNGEVRLTPDLEQVKEIIGDVPIP